MYYDLNRNSTGSKYLRQTKGKKQKNNTAFRVISDEDKSSVLEEILNINPKYNAGLIRKAYDKGRQLHDGQLRKERRTVFCPSISVAVILAQQHGRCDTDRRALHDAVEDTEYTREELVADFGEEIALLVDG